MLTGPAGFSCRAPIWVERWSKPGAPETGRVERTTLEGIIRRCRSWSKWRLKFETDARVFLRSLFLWPSCGTAFVLQSGGALRLVASLILRLCVQPAWTRLCLCACVDICVQPMCQGQLFLLFLTRASGKYPIQPVQTLSSGHGCRWSAFSALNKSSPTAINTVGNLCCWSFLTNF